MDPEVPEWTPTHATEPNTAVPTPNTAFSAQIHSVRSQRRRERPLAACSPVVHLVPGHRQYPPLPTLHPPQFTGRYLAHITHLALLCK